MKPKPAEAGYSHRQDMTSLLTFGDFVQQAFCVLAPSFEPGAERILIPMGHTAVPC
jgi:hypothetical protein